VPSHIADALENLAKFEQFLYGMKGWVAFGEKVIAEARRIQELI